MIAALLLLAGAGGEDVATRARASEEAAFVAVGEKRWCDALTLFLTADSLAPSPDLVFNAAQAAELGSDRARAMQLYTQLLGTTTSAARKSEAKGRIAALTKMVEGSGPGDPCPLPVTAAPVADAASAPVAPLPPMPAPAPAPALPPPVPGSPWPWVTAGAGTAAVVAGGAIAFVGVQPWFAHAAAREALAASEKQGATDGVDALYAEQERARADWVGWGQAAVAGGFAFAAVGVIAAAGGAVWGITGGGAE